MLWIKLDGDENGLVYRFKHNKFSKNSGRCYPPQLDGE